MKVRELIEELRKFNPEAEAHYPTEDGWDSTEICTVYESETQYGILLKRMPPPTKIVVLATGSEGL